jgi:rare lipoprotein A
VPGFWSISDTLEAMRVIALFMLGLLLVGVLSCCSSGDYRGYQTRGYAIRGQHYQPLSVEAALDYDETGIASWYDESKYFGFVRGNTSLGERVGRFDISGAHKTLPLPCRVKVTNLENGKTLKMRLNDRGPFIPGRIIDVTPRAAAKLGFKEKGLTRARVEVLSVGDGEYERKAGGRSGWWFW